MERVPLLDDSTSTSSLDVHLRPRAGGRGKVADHNIRAVIATALSLGVSKRVVMVTAGGKGIVYGKEGGDGRWRARREVQWMLVRFVRL